jgi:hypothetical protein
MKNSFYRMPLDLHSQAGQDVIENGRFCTGASGGFGMARSGQSKADKIQELLWDSGLHVDVVNLDDEKKVCISGDYAQSLLAKKLLSENGYTAYNAQ